MFKQDLLLLRYNKDVLCIVDKGQDPVCTTITSASRRSADVINNNVPSHDPYIPRSYSVFYNCTSLDCKPVELYSLTQVAAPNLNLKSCYNKSENYKCESIQYHYLKNEDKILFLTNSIPKKKFYTIDCLVYADRGRVCHRNDNADSHAKLVDTGTIARLNEPNVLSQVEFICEESEDKVVNCDLDSFVPYEEGLKLKPTIKISGDVLLKSGSNVVILKNKCIESWCGLSGRVTPTRRAWFNSYEPPGGSVYRCYYAKGQQICKKVHSRNQLLYNERNWLAV